MNSPVLNEQAADAMDVTAELQRLSTLVGDMLADANRLGASAAEVAVSRDVGLQVQVRNGDVETVEFNRDGGFGITVYFGQRKASVSSTDTRAEALQLAVRKACEIARHTADDPYAGLPDADRLATVFPELSLDHPYGMTADQAVELALRCEAAGLARHPQVKKTDSVSFSSHRGVRFYGNSLGFMAGVPSTRHSLSATLIAEDAGGMQRDWWYTVARDPAELLSAEEVGRKAADRAARRLGARRMRTGSVPVILVPEVARGFLGHLLSAIRGGNLYRKASFLCDALGKPVLPDWLSLRELPHVPKALGSGAFDDEGVATYEHDIVRAGVLDSYVLSSYSARRLGLRSTGNAGGVHNIAVQSQQQKRSFDQLLRELNEGVVITSVMGQGVNIVTGDYSRGASGFYVANGEIQYPVEEITIAGQLPQLLHGIRAMADDVEMQSLIWTGSLLVEGFTVASQGNSDE
nr:metalloprotease PmbA [Permianibacter fluminis]